jgi:hypothetical protein
MRLEAKPPSVIFLDKLMKIVKIPIIPKSDGESILAKIIETKKPII